MAEVREYTDRHLTISTKGFFFPKVATGQLMSDAVAMCQLLDIQSYREVENDNFRSGSYFLSESDQHYLFISGYFEDYFTDAIEEWGGKTVAEQLRVFAPLHDMLYEFKLTLIDAEPDTGPALMQHYVGVMAKACSVLFDLDRNGQKISLSIDLQET
ncbi:MAG: hypothetical protein ACRCTD_00190 [Beijerinckiaceae bacterium]